MSEMQLALTNTAGISSVMSFWVFAASNGFKNRKDLLVKIGSGTLILAFASLTAAIVIRGIDAQRFPLANLYESLLWFAWATMGGYLLLAKAYGVRQLGWLGQLDGAAYVSLRQLASAIATRHSASCPCTG